MEITGVRVFPVQEEKLKAFVSIVFDHCFMVNDIKVIQGKDSLFISMPSRRKRNGEYKDIAHPLNNETRRMLEERILEDYRSVVAGGDADKQGEKKEARIERVEKVEKVEKVERDVQEDKVSEEVVAAPAPAPIPAMPEETPKVQKEPEAAEDKSLEEVAEAHLRDSFWSVP